MLEVEGWRVGGSPPGHPEPLVEGCARGKPRTTLGHPEPLVEGCARGKPTHKAMVIAKAQNFASLQVFILPFKSNPPAGILLLLLIIFLQQVIQRFINVLK